MKRAFFCFASLCMLAVPIFSKPKIEDNTFTTKIINKSDFEITVEAKSPNEQVVASGQSVEHKFPLHTSALYDDSWSVEYKIPLSESAVYVLEEKKSIADKQDEFIIENPVGSSVNECYVVVDNLSNEVLNCSGAGGKTIIPVYEKGVINSLNSFPGYMLAANSVAVCKLSSLDSLFLATSSAKKQYYPTGISYRKGYVYYISYKDGKVTLRDARPIQSVKEKLWKKEYGRSVILRGIKTKGNKAFVLGTDNVKDAKGNLYSEGFIQRIDAAGAEDWKEPCSVKGADTYLYDIAFDGPESFLIAAQTVGADYEGLLLNYDVEGKLKKRLPVKGSAGFDTIRKDKSGNLYVRGADMNGSPLEYSVGAGLALSKVKPFDLDPLAEEFVQSVTAVLYDDDGATFIAGESARQERPTATVVQVKAGGGVDVLYSAREPNSYIMDMKIKRKEGVLLVCGSLDAKDSAGNGGKPFIRCVNIKSGVVEWEHIFKTSRYEVAFKIAEFESYGFGVLLVNANDEGNISAPCALVRTNAVGEFDF